MRKKSSTHSFFTNPRLVVFLASLLIVALAFAFQQKLGEFRNLGLAGIFLVNFFGAATLFLPAPAIVSVVAGGLLYPFWAVALASSLGAATGELVGYLIGHSGKHIVIKKKDHKLYVIFHHIFHRFGNISIYVFAFIPNPFFDFIGILAGVFAVPLWRFFLLVFLGRFTRDIMLAFFGSKLPF